jgi:hypothetical protein
MSSGSRIFPALLVVMAAGCSSPRQPESTVHAVYDNRTGKLGRLTIEATKDGKPNIVSYMDGTKISRIEIDDNRDGLVDRWEYYGPDQKLEKVGFSRLNDGKVDAWAYAGPDGSIARVEISTRRDGKANRTEFYEKGALVRAEEDTNADGRIDKWETYEGGALTSVGFDTKGAGVPDRRVEYPKPGKSGSVSAADLGQ